MRVSEEAVAAVKENLVVSREKRRRIQTMSKDELQGYLVALYREGFEDGANAALHGMDDVDLVEWDTILEVIGKVKGVGPALLQRIDEAVRGEFE